MVEKGVRHIFGIPGGQIMPLYDALYGVEEIDLILFRHEQGATHAAEGYSQVLKKPAVVLVTSGPGATNTVTGIVDAYMDSRPVVVIAGQVVTQFFGRDAFQETDILGITHPVTKFSVQVRDPRKLIPAFHYAYEISITGRPGPTLIDLPRDVQLAKVDGDDWSVRYPVEKYVPPPPREEDLYEAVKVISEARRPVILVGHGVYWSGATKEVIELAELLGAPIVSTLPGKNAVPHDHPLYMGPSGMHGRIEADAALLNADVVIAVGTRFADRTWGRFKELQEAVNSGDKKVIHIDADRSEIGKNVHATVSIWADAREALRQLIRLLPRAFARNEAFLRWLWGIRRAFEEAMTRWETEFRFFAPWRVLKTLRQVLPRDAITVTGVGSHQMWAELHWDVYVPGTFITSAGLGTMGFCVPAAIGAKAAAPDRPVLCIDGDGSFQMTFNNLAVSVERNLPIIVVVFNNSSLMLVKQWQIMMYANRIVATEFTASPDFVKLAEAFGIEGVRPSTYDELARAVARAVRNNEALVVDARIDPDKDIVLPFLKPGDWLDAVIPPPTMEKPDMYFKE